MRFFSFLTALVVMGVLYGFVMERDRLLAFAGASDAAQADSTAPQEQDSAEDDGVIRVMARHSTAQEINSAVQLRGETEALRQLEVRAETSGKVISDPLRKGAVVQAGDLLCEIDTGTRQVSLQEALAALAEAKTAIPTARARILEAEAAIPAAQARLQEAQARLAEAEINLNAAQKLAQRGYAAQTSLATDQASYESAQAGIKSARSGVEAANAALQSAQAGEESARSGIQAAQARVAAARKEIERVSIHAPFGGLLETDTAELGALMQPGSACATVIQLNPIKLVGFVPETEVARVQLGAKAGAKLVSGKTVQGNVTFVSRSADPVTRTFRVEIEVDNSDFAIRDGQTAEIAIASDGAMAHLLPQSALTLNDQGNLGLRLVDDAQRAKFHPIQLLRDTREGVWVSGLPAQANVILVGQEYVTDGVTVRPSYEELHQ